MQESLHISVRLGSNFALEFPSVLFRPPPSKPKIEISHADVTLLAVDDFGDAEVPLATSLKSIRAEHILAWEVGSVAIATQSRLNPSEYTRTDSSRECTAPSPVSLFGSARHMGLRSRLSIFVYPLHRASSGKRR
jgi:hypothetical protein